jgi:hypothetical protein
MATSCAAETGEGAGAASYDGQMHDDVWLAKQCRQIVRTTPTERCPFLQFYQGDLQSWMSVKPTHRNKS